MTIFKNQSELKEMNKSTEQYSPEKHLKIYSSLIAVLTGVILIGFSPYWKEYNYFELITKQLGLTCIISGITYWIFQNVFQKGNKEYTKQAIDHAVSTLDGSLNELNSKLKEVNERNKILNDSFTCSNNVLSGAFKSNLVQIYNQRNEGLNDIIEDMKTSETVKIIGISLRDYFNPSGKYFVEMEDILKNIRKSAKQVLSEGSVDGTSYSQPSRNIHILIINPFSEQATIRAERESDEEYFSAENPYEESGLYSDVWQTLRYLGKKVNDSCGISAKIYNSSPSCFLVITDKYTYIEQYHYGIRKSGLVGGTYPLLKFSNDNIIEPNKELEATVTSHLKGHFEYIWDSQNIRSKPISYLLREYNLGTSISAWECGVNNIFQSRSNAQKRISYLLANEQKEIKLIGISLRDFLHAGNDYYPVISDLLTNPNTEHTVEIKVLLLDPISYQGILRSEREEPGVKRGNLYSEVITSIRSIQRLQQQKAKIIGKLYSSSTHCFCVITGESIFVEQYHYGSSEPEATILGGKIPVIEFNSKSSSYKQLEGNFDFIWDNINASKTMTDWLCQITTNEPYTSERFIFDSGCAIIVKSPQTECAVVADAPVESHPLDTGQITTHGDEFSAK